ncbi:hypothetical protein G6O69_18410 [Pseudenhygromyxa sp. WMMC2535]|uniref:hypothetical protein n=1 Tax=Pseudenhygromyxa sp. WMMC2535 TaxID=2712867 RepID=UPI00159563A1|nr:hypothetical protein [Pseudenhygromyxa sp. WMMC2535]NVB39822.1 hypothetical protein [Pseudenhygromyxa sp. WMMC2535]
MDQGPEDPLQPVDVVETQAPAAEGGDDDDTNAEPMPRPRCRTCGQEADFIRHTTLARMREAPTTTWARPPP